MILDQFAENDLHPEVVFGSRFSDDVSYTQVCLSFPVASISILLVENTMFKAFGAYTLCATTSVILSTDRCFSMAVMILADKAL